MQRNSNFGSLDRRLGGEALSSLGGVGAYFVGKVFVVLLISGKKKCGGGGKCGVGG